MLQQKIPVLPLVLRGGPSVYYQILCSFSASCQHSEVRWHQLADFRYTSVCQSLDKPRQRKGVCMHVPCDPDECKVLSQREQGCMPVQLPVYMPPSPWRPPGTSLGALQERSTTASACAVQYHPVASSIYTQLISELAGSQLRLRECLGTRTLAACNGSEQE
jgi:hypothetical protein